MAGLAASRAHWLALLCGLVAVDCLGSRGAGSGGRLVGVCVVGATVADVRLAGVLGGLFASRGVRPDFVYGSSGVAGCRATRVQAGPPNVVSEVNPAGGRSVVGQSDRVSLNRS
jgi:hypothetical protein